MSTTLIKSGLIINEGKRFEGDILIENDRIKEIGQNLSQEVDTIIDAKGKWILPGVIDDQVHFREPGLTEKANIYTESKAAVSGGTTSFMEMPNTNPATLTQTLLQEKYDIAAKDSIANYSFYMGASNDNLEEVLKTDPKKVCGIKVFMGSSTGNMLVNNAEVLEGIFSKSKLLIATHCEDEDMVQHNLAAYKERFGEDVPMKYHPEIRSEEACYKSSSMAVALAKKHNTRLHVLHITTGKELALFDDPRPLGEKKVTCEICVHHIWFNDQDYADKGTFIKWNPAVKTEADRSALFNAVLDNTADVIATDHAPHTLKEKQNTYFKAPSGGPLIQHSLIAMLEFVHKGQMTLEHVVKKMAHDVAVCFDVQDRGYLREGYFADIVIVAPEKEYEVTGENINYKCAWSPFEGEVFHNTVEKTFVNGNIVYDQGTFDESKNGMRLSFNR